MVQPPHDERFVPPAEKKPVNPWLLVLGVPGAVLLVVFGGLLAASFFITSSVGLTPNEQLMPDGTILRIERIVTSGSSGWNYEFTPSGPFGQFRRRIQHVNIGIQPGQIGIWMSRRSASGVPMDFDWWWKSVVLDESGDEIADQNPYYYQFGDRGTSGSSGNRPFRSDKSQHQMFLAVSTFRGFRTDGGKFTLKVLNASGEIVAKFSLTHPSPPTAPTWEAENLPLTKSNGPLSATVTELNVQSHAWSDNGQARTGYSISPQVTFSWDGQPTKHWGNYYVTFHDSLGNHWDGFHQLLSVKEPAWKMRVHAFRTSDATFSPAEQCHFPDIPLVDAGKAEKHSESGTADGQAVSLLMVAGRDEVNYSFPSTGGGTYTGGVHAFGKMGQFELRTNSGFGNLKLKFDNPHVAFQIDATMPNKQFLLRAVDDQKRSVPTHQHAIGSALLFFLDPAADAKSVSLTLIIHQGRELEFLIKPPKLADPGEVAAELPPSAPAAPQLDLDFLAKPPAIATPAAK